MIRTRVLAGLALAAIAALATPAAAQIVGSPQSITVVDSGTACVTAPTACATFALDNSTGALTVSVSGTWTGTLTFEGTNNDGVWTSLLATNLATAAQATTTTAGGLFTVTNAGVIKVRVRATATITGSALITAAKGLGFARAGPNTVSLTGLATTSTDGMSLLDTTPATGAATVQISPRTKWCGTAWNSVGSASETDCLLIEVLPATAAGTTTATLKVGYIDPSGTVTYPLTLSSAGALAALGAVQAASGSTIGWASVTKLVSSTDKLLTIRDSAAATGAEITVGSATLGTCTAGTITTGSHNFAGGYTGNTSGSCIVNFGTPNWTNAPFCLAMSIASTTHPRISAVSTSSMTVTGGVSGEAITYHCWGRIGT